MDIDIDKICGVARDAGSCIMDIYNSEFDVTYKPDHSPLTEADRAANLQIINFLNASYPNIPIISAVSYTHLTLPTNREV